MLDILADRVGPTGSVTALDTPACSGPANFTRRCCCGSSRSTGTGSSPSGRHVRTFVGYGADARPEQTFPPTGRRFATTQTHWFRMADGKIIEHWANRDDLGTATQLGWTPPTPAYLVRMLLATRRARREAGRGPRGRTDPATNSRHGSASR